MMYLKIPVINKKYTPLLKNRKISKQVQEEFAYYMAEEMKKYLKKVVRNQQYKRFWAPLSPGYLEYKEKKGLSTNIWEATGYLVDNITVRKYGDHYLVGVSQTKNYPGTNTKLFQVAKWMEYGTAKMPARPLFFRVYEYMRKHVDDYFKKFIKEKGY